MLIRVTGATGKVGRSLVARPSADEGRPDVRIRALRHDRRLERGDRIDLVSSFISGRAVVRTTSSRDLPRRPGPTRGRRTIHAKSGVRVDPDRQDRQGREGFWPRRACRRCDCPGTRQWPSTGGGAKG
jgi:hypothetical protein